MRNTCFAWVIGCAHPRVSKHIFSIWCFRPSRMSIFQSSLPSSSQVIESSSSSSVWGNWTHISMLHQCARHQHPHVHLHHLLLHHLRYIQFEMSINPSSHLPNSICVAARFACHFSFPWWWRCLHQLLDSTLDVPMSYLGLHENQITPP